MVEIYQFTHGEMACTVINDGYVTIKPASACFEGATPEELDVEFATYGIEHEGFALPCSIMLVEMNDRKILVDCGSDGEMNGYDGDLGHLFTGLDEVGISTDAITDVILTHGHFDHFAGCANDDGSPKFVNATYYLSDIEWDRWVANNDGNSLTDRLARLKLGGIKEQLELVSPDVEIFEGVRLLATPGHTIGHVSVEFELGDAVLLCHIDVMDHYLQGRHPTWGANWDEDRAQSLVSRRRMLERAVEKNALVHGFHFPFPGLGRFTYDGEVWLWNNHV